MTTHRVPDLLLERLVRGELPPDQAAALQARLDAEPDGPQRLQALAESDRQILFLHPPATVAARVHRRLGRRRLAVGALLGSPVLAAALALVALRIPGDPGVWEPEGQDRPKGPEPVTEIRVYRDDGSAGQRLEAGALLQPSDLLQVAYVAGGRPYGVIVSVDGAGSVTLHFPPQEGASTALTGGGETLLPFSYELDDAPVFERFFLVTSTDPLAPDRVVDAARALARQGRALDGDLPLPDTLSQTSLLLRKETP